MNRGERCGMAKLTWADVREIRRHLAEGGEAQSLAEEYGVKRTEIYRIKYGTRWKE